MQQDKTFLGTEPVGQLLRRLAIPTVIAQLVNMLYNIVDRIYIGHIPEVGSLALTGVGVCLPIILIVSAFACFTASGGAPRASIYMGRDDMDSAEKDARRLLHAADRNLRRAHGGAAPLGARGAACLRREREHH